MCQILQNWDILSEEGRHNIPSTALYELLLLLLLHYDRIDGNDTAPADQQSREVMKHIFIRQGISDDDDDDCWEKKEKKKEIFLLLFPDSSSCGSAGVQEKKK